MESKIKLISICIFAMAFCDSCKNENVAIQFERAFGFPLPINASSVVVDQPGALQWDKFYKIFDFSLSKEDMQIFLSTPHAGYSP